MYGAKADAIGKAALDTWAPGKSPTDKTKAAVREGVFLVVDDPKAAVADLDGIAAFPAVLKHKEFIALARSLATNPLAG